ncbi:MAG: PadR family transcriptional regulator [Nitrospirae bacterium RIFCSPLOWO2_02_FULL_62_14]|nr:MAG: PadR family transcriptional regulator [Nitrospirae bacterium RIFCSPLOWO2_02_FULL_62_14]OGW70300.1 MAG: PadR family transcriptional regulator [Nitrospirae bacterium RIFCSPLOWO2_01_FULL_62_17]
MKKPETSRRLVRQFFLGFVRLHILYHASEEPVCGVELSSELASHGYRLSPGTLYPILHALAASGYLRRAVRVEQGRQRKVYTLTRRGEEALTQAREHLRELVEEVMGEGKGRARG